MSKFVKIKIDHKEICINTDHIAAIEPVDQKKTYIFLSSLSLNPSKAAPLFYSYPGSLDETLQALEILEK